jgi:uncharacterized protein YjhX (UPF0386 family)
MSENEALIGHKGGNSDHRAILGNKATPIRESRLVGQPVFGPKGPLFGTSRNNSRSRLSYETPMNISRNEQRVLHVLALGGRIMHESGEGNKIIAITCVTREGMILADCDLAVFKRLRRKRLIESRSGSPYRISTLGRATVRPQFDNQGSLTC